MHNAKLITKAAAFAAEAHALQTRKELNESYVTHPLRVGELAARLGAPAEVIAAAYLHDVIEDTDFEVADLADFPARVVELVVLLTKWDAKGVAGPGIIPAKDRDDYYRRIAEDPQALFLKLLDRVDNMRDMVRTAGRSPSMKRWAERYLAKTLVEFQILEQEATEWIHGPQDMPTNGRFELTAALTLFKQTLATLGRTLAGVDK